MSVCVCVCVCVCVWCWRRGWQTGIPRVKVRTYNFVKQERIEKKRSETKLTASVLIVLFVRLFHLKTIDLG